MNGKFLGGVVILVGLVAGCQQAAEPAPPEGTPRVLEQKVGAKNVGILIFDDLFITELSGPHDVYHHVPADKRNVFTIAPTMAKITTYEKIIIQPDFSFENAPKIDILVVPSGNHSLDTDLDNKALIDFVRSRAATAERVTSHCWGAFVLGKAGLLDGKQATTFPGYEDDLKAMFPQINTVTTARYVKDGNIVTSNGGLAAYEASTFVSRELWGADVAKTITSGIVFSPDNETYSSNPAR